MGLAACSSPGDAEPHADVESMFTKNVAHWVMPLDSFVLAPESPKQSTARWALVRTCMVDKGHTDYPAPPYSSDVDSQTRNSSSRILFDGPRAARWGYRDEPIVDPDVLQAAHAQLDAIADAAPADFESCDDSAADAMGPPPQSTLDVAAVGVGAYAAAKQDPAVLAAVDTWKKCMAPQGVVDLPDDPYAMPSDSLRTRFGWSSDARPSQAGADEIAVATADAACRESSGFTQVRYDAEWDRQLAQVEDNLAALERAKEAWDDYEARLDGLIAANGG
ncbi:hypothetical protein Cch01nite_15620 [Cellulomonas chitinilytica]|uniref:Uncharacterized protein n=2 Tax=Cellulomonas chitinilytica TaxID=398759 RepID=A0A919P030_9CELL|nr:hypothetical protein Cch01nite_15620 [Cellulomonas chitinilytica]